jgi:hypothetical protein
MILKKIANEIDKIWITGKKCGFDVGEIHVIIARNFGLKNREIPVEKVNEIQQFFIKNTFRKFQLLAPQHHDILMQTENEYSKDFRKNELHVRTEW